LDTKTTTAKNKVYDVNSRDEPVAVLIGADIAEKL